MGRSSPPPPPPGPPALPPLEECREGMKLARRLSRLLLAVPPNSNMFQYCPVKIKLN